MLTPPPRLAVAFWIALVVLILVPHARGGPSDDAGPVFVQGDVEDLRCRVRRVPADDGAPFLVDVTNRGRATAEPVVFVLRVRGRGADETPLVRRRVADPVWGRAGRAVAPGKTLRYTLSAPPGWERGARVEAAVLEASFFEGEGATKPPLRLENLGEVVVVDPVVGERRVRRFALENAGDLDVDAILLGTEEDGAKARRLLLLRVPAGGRVETGDLAAEAATPRPAQYVVAGDRAFAKLELVDWSVVHPAGEERARRALEAAWEGWTRWPSGTGVRGRVRWHLERDAPSDAIPPTDGEAPFRLGPGAHIPHLEGLPPGAVRAALEAGLALAFAPVRRPSFAAALGGGRLALLDAGPPVRVEVHGAADEDAGFTALPVFTLEDGRIAARTPPTGFAGERHVYETASHGAGGWALVAEEAWAPIGGEDRLQERRAWTWRDHATAGLAPVTFERVETRTFLSTRSRLTLTFADLAVEAPARPDAGPSLPAALERAWNAPWRHPDEPVDLDGRFHVACAPGAAEWAGRSAVRGTATLHGYTGIPSPVLTWARTTVRFEEDAEEATHAQWRSLLEGRSTIFSRHDPAAWPPAETAFAGRRIRAAGGDAWEVEDGPLARVVVRDGRVVALHRRDGTVWRYAWTTVGERRVVERVSVDLGDRTATIDVSWAPLGETRLFPAKVAIRDWFAPGFAETWTWEVLPR